MKSSVAIREACDNARGELIDISEQKLRAAVMNGEPWAVAMVLKTLGKSRGYVERQEVTGANGKPVETKITEIVIRKEVDGETAE